MVLFLTDLFSVWNSTTSFRMNNVAKRRIRLDDGEKSKIVIVLLLLRKMHIRINRMVVTMTMKKVGKDEKRPTKCSFLTKFLKYNSVFRQKFCF